MTTTIAVGETAPAFELAGIDGKRYLLTDALANGSLLAVFFKVTCPTCQFTLPFIERLYQEFQAKGIQIWGISQDTRCDSQRFAEQFGLTFPLLLDEEPYETSQEYGLVYVPTLFLINREGQVEISGDGFSKSDLLEIQHSFAKYFDANPGEFFRAGEKLPEYKPG